jgi:hypothetical protein
MLFAAAAPEKMMRLLATPTRGNAAKKSRKESHILMTVFNLYPINIDDIAEQKKKI